MPHSVFLPVLGLLPSQRPLQLCLRPTYFHMLIRTQIMCTTSAKWTWIQNLNKRQTSNVTCATALLYGCLNFLSCFRDCNASVMRVLSGNVSFFNLSSAIVIMISCLDETPNLEFLKQLSWGNQICSFICNCEEHTYRSLILPCVM